MDIPREKKLPRKKVVTTSHNLDTANWVSVNCKSTNPDLIIEANRNRIAILSKTIKMVTVNPDGILKWSNVRLLKNADNKEGVKIIKVNNKKNKNNHIYVNSANKALKSIIKRESRDGRNV